VNIIDSLRRWRPRRIADLFKGPGYGDRTHYYVPVFSLFIAFIGSLGIILLIVQTVYAVRLADDNSIETAVDAVDDQVAALSQKLEIQFAALLNVSQEILVALQALRTNGTV